MFFCNLFEIQACLGNQVQENISMWFTNKSRAIYRMKRKMYVWNCEIEAFTSLLALRNAWSGSTQSWPITTNLLLLFGSNLFAFPGLLLASSWNWCWRRGETPAWKRWNQHGTENYDLALKMNSERRFLDRHDKCNMLYTFFSFLYPTFHRITVRKLALHKTIPTVWLSKRGCSRWKGKCEQKQKLSSTFKSLTTYYMTWIYSVHALIYVTSKY